MVHFVLKTHLIPQESIAEVDWSERGTASPMGYACAMRCPVLVYAVLLRTRYAMPGTDM